MKLFLIAVLNFCLLIVVIAGSGDKFSNDTSKIKGIIYDSKTGEVLAGVAVKLDGLNQTVYTDFMGNFEFENVVPGKYDLTVSMLSYTPVRQAKVEVKPYEIHKLEIKLEVL